MEESVSDGFKSLKVGLSVSALVCSLSLIEFWGMGVSADNCFTTYLHNDFTVVSSGIQINLLFINSVVVSVG